MENDKKLHTIQIGVAAWKKEKSEAAPQKREDEEEDEEEHLHVYTMATVSQPKTRPDLFRACFIPEEYIDIKIISITHRSHEGGYDPSRISVMESAPGTRRRRKSLKELTHVDLNPHLYEIGIQHGPYKWTIYRRFKHFRLLHDHLLYYRAKMHIPLPSRYAKGERKTYLTERKTAVGALGQFIPPFPKKLEMNVHEEDLDDRKTQLENYLRTVCNSSALRNCPALLKFLEISCASFVAGSGEKFKEGQVKRRRALATARCHLPCLQNPRFWGTKWMFLKDTYIGYFDMKTWEIVDVFLMDLKFKIEIFNEKKQILKLTNSARTMFCRCWTDRKLLEWKKSIERVALTTAMPFTSPNPNESFAPLRDHIPIRWFVDGILYMEAVADSINRAKEEIFIADWWLSPEIYLKRIPERKAKWRLDNLLFKKANQGVMVYIMLYKEVEMALSINSGYSKRTLTSLHENIKLIRHPDHLRGLVLLWAHHEKCVVIDQSIAFLGGLDLCYGRWDTQEHLLFDMPRDDEKTATEIWSYNMDCNANLDKQFFTMRPYLNDNNISSVQSEGLTPIIEQKPLSAKWNNLLDTLKAQTSSSTVPADAKQVEHSDEMDSSSKRQHRNTEPTEDRSPKGSVVKQNFPIKQSKGREQIYLDSVSKTDATSESEVPSQKSNWKNRSYRSSSAHSIGSNSDHQQARRKTVIARLKESIQHPDPDHEVRAGNIADITDQLMQKRVTFKNCDDGQLAVDVRKVTHKPTFKPPMGSLARAASKFKSIVHHPSKAVLEFSDDSSDDDDDFHSATKNRIRSELYRQSIEATSIESPYWLGKDYVNWIVKDCVDLDKPHEDLVDRNEVPRMPWHDVACCVYGRSARDVGRHFIQRWNAAKFEKFPKSRKYPMIVPKTYDHLGVHKARYAKAYNCKVQILRSATRWSTDIDYKEFSIQNAYINAISNSKHFVYIENQFFVSSTSKDTLVQNQIAAALFERILKAHIEKRHFRVYIVVPLLPAFEGKIGKSTGSAIQAVLHYQMTTLFKGKNSLFGKLYEWLDPTQYISVCGLRTWDTKNGKLFSEIIYVHTKMMVVDDRVTIIGSANINDRSQMGTRDGELAVYVEDTQFRRVKFSGAITEVGPFASTLRMSLMREHLGVPIEYNIFENKNAGPDPQWDYTQLEDPTSDLFFNDIWTHYAAKNDKIFNEVFNCIPCFDAATFDEVEQKRSKIPLAESDPDLAREKLRHTEGSLVRFPQEFLQDENLEPALGTKESLAPCQLWT